MSAECQIVERPVIRRRGSYGRRNILFRASPLCHWCGVLTRQPHHPNGILDDDSATLDHIAGRLECESADQYHALTNQVLACHLCNRTRNETYMSTYRPSGEWGLPPSNLRRRLGIPRKVRAHTPSAFDRPVASWRY